ncbi:sensor histidine kinase [Saccharicrinis aurantiacus]|uniref:sensor histidine kinase n=1 Tax=Saccharicrinis aurantiacus TaxID=1849719 RepID=UPI0009F81A58|nr:histidine kinase [Saccharicrinis aurantiacus]
MKSKMNYRIFMIPLMVLLMISSSFGFMLFFGFKDLSDVQQIMPLRKISLIILQVIITITIYYFWIKKLNKILPWNKIWIARFAVDASTAVLMAFSIISLIKILEQVGFFPPNVKHFESESIFIMPLMIHTLYISLIELSLAYEERNDLKHQVSHLEKLHISSQYKALKDQLDHHFLFNNLSVLSSIIYEDVDKADVFIQRLSSVYRYVLSINKKDLVTVDEEIKFIESYLQLYKFRFEVGFNYNINVPAEYRNMMIPPLTLQVLAENSIKHNVASRSHPLEIKIYTKCNTLVVENNLQLREGAVDSTHTGMQNLNDKYQLLGMKKPQVTNNDKMYQVAINLIQSSND